MKRFLNSSIGSMILLAIVVGLLCFTFKMRTEWWMFIDIFALFMAAFCNIMGVTINKMKIPGAQRKLNIAALGFFVIFVIALIVEFILFQTM